MSERRNRLTLFQVRALLAKQDGKCGNSGCQTVLVIGRRGRRVNFLDEHIIALKRGGTNDLSNRELWCLVCARQKTFGTKATTAGSDIHMIAKAKRWTKMGVEKPSPGNRKPKTKKYPWGRRPMVSKNTWTKARKKSYKQFVRDG